MLNSKKKVLNKKFNEFMAKSIYADVYFKANSYVMYVHINYKNVKDVGAMHIHANNNGKPGSILAWLATSDEWQHGVDQNKPNGNKPCCIKSNPNCSFIAPNGIPFVNSIRTPSTQTFVIYNENVNCNACPWIDKGTLFFIHGKVFQQNYDNHLTLGKPNADILYHTPFFKI